MYAEVWLSGEKLSLHRRIALWLKRYAICVGKTSICGMPKNRLGLTIMSGMAVDLTEATPARFVLRRFDKLMNEYIIPNCKISPVEEY